VFVDFNSPWFPYYSRAVLTDNARARRRFVEAALNAIDETLSQPGLKEEERARPFVASYARCELLSAANAPKLRPSD
jgi:hypothetical protein